MTMSLSPMGSPNLNLLHAALPWREEAPGEEAQLLRTPDGVGLMATRFEPLRPARAVAVIAPATGVPQRFYAPFARWLATQGYAVLTLDYRGLGASQPSAHASMRDWMLTDLPTALQAARRRARAADGSSLPLVWIGHSLGGHALALLDGIEHLDAALCIGSQLPAFRRWPSWKDRLGARFFFKTWLPLWVRLTGRLPGWALGGGLTLPGPAAMDWSRWGQMDNYFASDEAMRPHLRAQRFRGVAHLWCVSDDWVFAPEAAVRALEESFDGAPGRATVHRIAPHDVGLRRLGHFGAFRRHGDRRLWPLLLARLEAEVPALRTAQ